MSTDKPSQSPERHTFQLERYLERKLSEEKTPDNDENVGAMVNFYETVKTRKAAQEQDPEWQKNNLEWDLRTTDWILEKVRTNDAYAQNLYAAMCNQEFQRNEVWPVLKDERWSCSWRYAGGIIADMRQEGDYIDWYCSGMGGLNREYDSEETNEEWQKRTGYVPESLITEEIRNDLLKLGWVPCDIDDSI